MDFRTVEISNFFLSLEQYALGDLKLFHKLADAAESKERENANFDNSSYVTTMNPSSFEFNLGKPVYCRATIPFTMMIFSCMDILGYLTDGGSHTDTKKNIRSFFKFVSSSPNYDEISDLVKMFRHGLAHNYFPKVGNSISYHSRNPSTLFFNDGSVVCLNVNILEKYFLEGFGKIKNSENLHMAMEQNFQKLNTIYLNEVKK